jgi:hypothetical protein
MTRVLALLLVLLTSSLASAQEFKLEITATFPKPGQIVFPVFLGYDPIAEDSLEYKTKAWKEERTFQDPIGKISIFEQPYPENPQGRDFAFRDPGALYGRQMLEMTKMDIRKKPTLDSFMMRWVLYIDASNETVEDDDRVNLTWDRNQIPSDVRHLVMRYRNEETIVDMKTTNAVTVWTDSLQNNGGSLNVGITAYVNMDIPTGTSSVGQSRANEISLRAYPNPAIAHSKILLELAQTEYVTLSIYDVQGREIMTHSFVGDMGMNEIAIDREQLGLAGGVYFVRAMIGTGSDQVLKTTSIRLQ